MRIVRNVVAVAVTLGVVVAPAAHAGTRHGLSALPGFGAVVVDQVHRRVFVSGGPTGNSVVVTDFHGGFVKDIDGQSGATGLALSADSATLYVADAAGDAVSAVDTTTFAQTAHYTTPAQTCPTTLARTGQFLWIGYGCADGTFSGGIGRIDTAAATPTITLGQQGSATFEGAPLLASADGGTVVAAQANLSLSTTDVYSVDAGSLKPGASGTVAGSNVNDVAVSPDGTTLFTAAGSDDHVGGLATSDLSGRGAYPTGHFPNAVSVAPDGGFLAAGAATSAHEVFVFATGGTSPVRTVHLGSRIAAARGTAWSADAKNLFVVTEPVSGGSPDLAVIDHPESNCTLFC